MAPNFLATDNRILRKQHRILLIFCTAETGGLCNETCIKRHKNFMGRYRHELYKLVTVHSRRRLFLKLRGTCHTIGTSRIWLFKLEAILDSVFNIVTL